MRRLIRNSLSYLGARLVKSGVWALREVDSLNLVSLLVGPKYYMINSMHVNAYLVTTVLPLRASCSSAWYVGCLALMPLVMASLLMMC